MSFVFIQSDVGTDDQEILISGYIREIQDFDFDIPHDIILLFINYSRDSLSWKIMHDKFIKFQNKAEQSVDDWNYEILLGPTFNVRGFQFQCNIASVSRAEFVQFQIRLKSINNEETDKNTNIRSIVAYYEVCCDETKSSEKDTKILHEIGDEMSWPMYNMRVKECINLNSFTFNVYVDIFKINYKRTSTLNNTNNQQKLQNGHIKNGKNKITDKDKLKLKRDIHFRPIKMYNKVTFSWIINNELLKQFKKSNFGKYWYSPNFGLDGTELNGDNFAWCLYCAPHGYNHSMNDKVYIGIVLLNLPPKIRKIEINFMMKCEITYNQQKNGVQDRDNYDKIEYQQVGKIMHYRDNCAAWPGNDKLKIKDLKRINDDGDIVISIQIDIVKVVNDKGNEVNVNDWEYLGIIRKTMFPKANISKSFSWLQYLHQR